MFRSIYEKVQISLGVAYVYASFNDTFVHVTDLLDKQLSGGAPAA
ncbi:conserved hypothetical protein [Culex quinquefasciatus]|uniref:40S ribosomal protein S14 n=1 Tax=Culex quinquefasciatus TaxID=7176 RepID=B0XD63_CULQU|nr:conserved hypothetical protein [Culex quinquefasciatus]|eukprot:XP_001867585.1 conserved hypothetical protein [Culex quinquefasciatus]